MQVIVKARQMKLTEALKAYAEEKLGHSTAKIFDRPAAKIDIELSKLAHKHGSATEECRVTVFMPKGKTVVIVEVDDNMYKAIDLAHDRLLLQVKRERGRASGTHRAQKSAEAARNETARQTLTSKKELWEGEVAAYESQSAPL